MIVINANTCHAKDQNTIKKSDITNIFVLFLTVWHCGRLICCIITKSIRIMTSCLDKSNDKNFSNYFFIRVPKQ